MHTYQHTEFATNINVIITIPKSSADIKPRQHSQCATYAYAIVSTQYNNPVSKVQSRIPMPNSPHHQPIAMKMHPKHPSHTSISSARNDLILWTLKKQIRGWNWGDRGTYERRGKGWGMRWGKREAPARRCPPWILVTDAMIGGRGIVEP